MRTLILPAFFLAALLFSGRSYAQGWITFGNRIPGVIDAPIFGAELSSPQGDWQNAKSGNTGFGVPAGTQSYGGAPLEGFYVGFWATRVQIPYDGRLFRPADVVVSLGHGPSAGYFPTTNVFFSSLPPSGTAQVQVRVWDSKYGADPSGWLSDYYLDVSSAGASSPFFARIGDVASDFRSFSLGFLDDYTLAPPIPEPETIPLILLAVSCAARIRARSGTPE